MEKIEKRIKKLNKRIICANDSSDRTDRQRYESTLIGVAIYSSALMGIRAGFSCVGSLVGTPISWVNIVLNGAYVLGIGVVAKRVVPFHMKNYHKIRVKEYLDELHGYALEENKVYTKKILSSKKR